jgi:PAS domain S-box-containing protein
LSRPGFGFEDLIATAADPAFVLDPLEDRFVAANSAGCAMLGYPLEELLQMPVSRIHPGELAQLRDFVGKVLRDGHGSTIKLACRTRFGDYLPTEMMLWAYGDDGRVLVLALVHDRSQHRRGGGD